MSLIPWLHVSRLSSLKMLLKKFNLSFCPRRDILKINLSVHFQYSWLSNGMFTISEFWEGWWLCTSSSELTCCRSLKTKVSGLPLPEAVQGVSSCHWLLAVSPGWQRERKLNKSITSSMWFRVFSESYFWVDTRDHLLRGIRGRGIGGTIFMKVVIS